ncbi:large ribosomal subunit protein uL10m-like [Lasioglossum baleicum]|uniref:large ribosomal subunit protein uL10m-like n=1 Tax=Lasioglossum baleicum TaxID=434251 RepID=UPI003FCD68A8
MAQLVQKAFQLTPNQLLYQQKRFRGKINLKKPKIFYKKRIMNELLTPFFQNPRPNKTIESLCAKAIAPQTFALGPYEKILAREARNWFDKSRMVACVHANSISMLDLFEVQVPLRRANMYYKGYSPKLIRAALEGTSYEDKLAPLICLQTKYIFCPEINVVALEKILKRCPQICTIGGILEGEVLSYHDFLKYGKMDIATAQLGLVQVLQNAGGVHLNQQLTHHQTTLVSRLKQIGTNGSATNEDEQSVPV